MRSFFAALACLLLAVPVLSAPSASTAPAKPATLETALTALAGDSLPQSTLIMTVDPAGVRPDPAVSTDQNEAESDQAGYVPAPPPDPSTLQGVLMIYSRTYQPFGQVAAITAPTMTELTLDPKILDLDPVDLSPDDAMKILLGSLSKGQWQQVASGGLAVGDLDDDQQALLSAAVHAPFYVVPSTRPYNPPRWTNGENYNDFIDKAIAYDQDYQSPFTPVTQGMVAGARLKAYLATSYSLPVPGGQNGMSIGIPGNASIPDLYQISMAESPPATRDSLADLVMPKEPNTLKPGDLNWNSRALGAMVSVDDVKTVGDLVAQVTKATGLELYCDPHYASRSVLMLGDTSRPERAGELLEALCVCVSGTFRAVGPAYVLTDDVLGVASRDTLLEDLGTSWRYRLNKLTEQADQHLNDDEWAKSLGFYPGDPSALTPDQLGAAEKPQSGNDLSLTFSQLPAATQSDVQAAVNKLASFPGNVYGTSIQGALGPTYKMTAMIQMRIVLDVPNVGPVALDNGSSYMDVLSGHNGGTPPGPPLAPTGPQKPALYPSDLAGVIATPRTATEARALVDKMASMGLRLLYCEAFTAGKAYVANSGIAPDSADAAAVLPAAIEEGKAKGVKVIAVVDAFSWGTTDFKSRLSPLPDGVAEDQTVTLETGTASETRRIAEPVVPDYGVAAPGIADRWVSPSNPAVQNALALLVSAVAATPGLAGIAFQDVAPPGYLSDHDAFDPRTTALGYSPVMRLTFLRAQGVDPIDIDDNIGMLSVGMGVPPVNLDIPSFDSSRDTPGGKWLPSKELDWKKARAAADEDEMARLYDAARGASATLPLYLRDPVAELTFAPWVDAKMPNPAQASDGQIDLSKSSPGTMFALDFGPIRGYAYMLPGVLSTVEGMVADAKTPVGLLFDLAMEPGPDGPVRDLTVIGEHVTFAAPEKPSAQKPPATPSQ